MSAPDRSDDRFFIDTNIFVYCFDDRQPEKKVRALALISEALQTRNGMISWQVIQEFLNVSTRKFQVPLKPEDANVYLQKVLHPLYQVSPDLDVYSTALDIMKRTNYSFYDSLILAGAIRGGCTILYSEDLKTGHQVDGVKVVNPFL
jgi:predicted nucleic acid-binding protein